MWEREQGATEDQAEEFRDQVHSFISDREQSAAFLMTRRRDGREIMRPVGTSMDGWTVTTVTQDVQPKTSHVRRDPVVGYLWTGREHREDWPGPGFNPKVVWMQGRAELIEDQDRVAAFFDRRREVTGRGRTHAESDTLYLIRVTPQYVRAEGWLGSHALVYRQFPS